MAQIGVWQHIRPHHHCWAAGALFKQRLAACRVRLQGPARQISVTCHASKKKLVFLGTPEVAAGVLQDLVAASNMPDSSFEVSMVVTQPAKPRGRGNKSRPVPSPVEAAALALGLAEHRILKPASAKEEPFLSSLHQLQPDLCVTAAYGNMLPTAFLAIPRHGTLNIHPSLLPKYRGAAPVPRALQDGVPTTGVSVAFTVLKCDAGPVLAQQAVAVEPHIQTPELLQQLFKLGTQLLLRELPGVWEGRAAEKAVAQDEARATHAAKISKEEGRLVFEQHSAQQLHDKVRAFAGWPGTFADLVLEDPQTGSRDVQTVKVLQTRVHEGVPLEPLGKGQLLATKEGLFVHCGGASVLELLKVQPSNKKPMSAKDYMNGLAGRKVYYAYVSGRDSDSGSC